LDSDDKLSEYGVLTNVRNLCVVCDSKTGLRQFSVECFE